MGAGVPAPAAGIAWHGVLMASAFFGTLIALERAVALGRLWAYAAPAASAAGGIALLAGYGTVALALFVAGSALFSLVSLVIYQRQPALHIAVLAAGSLCLLGANLWLLSDGSLDRATPLWIAFFVLTIGGERLELSRLVPVPARARQAFGAIAFALAVGALLAWPAVHGALLVAMAVWLARYDLATRTVRGRGITRYIALCLLSGYVWLALGGALLVIGAARDAALHAILLGFVFSMVFGHAPVILPAVLRIALLYRAAFYVPLAVLHASVALRFAAGFADSPGLRLAGGIGNALAIVLFIATAVAVVATARK
jgi:hypothetical protein